MINVNEIFEEQLLCEGINNPKHIFDDGELTFADIRDILTRIFSGGLTITEQVDGLDLFITYKDGNFCVATDPKDIKNPININKLNAQYCDGEPEVKNAFMNSIKDLNVALSELDPVQLNKFFANGQNFMSCKIVYPPSTNVGDYHNKCFITLNKLMCFNDKFKEVGEDTDSAKTLFDVLNNNGSLQQETFEIAKPNILKIKNLTSSKNVLKKILDKLNTFIDGVGWKCSLNGYIQDRYGRHIVNKALEHGLDVSRNSEFVNQLASRLSNISGRKPTRSDLVTYAKREGVNCKCQEYKDFIQDLEQNCEQTNSDIIKPIEQLIAYAALMLMKNVEGYMTIDPSSPAARTLATIDDAVIGLKEDEIDLTPEKIQVFKKNLARIEKYHEMMPKAGVLIRFKGKVYKMQPNFGDPHEITKIISY